MTDEPTLFDVPEEAHARRTDPETSHEAAASLSSDKIRRSQEEVLDAIKRLGRCTDAEIIQSVYVHTRIGQSDSGIRTRRSELVAKGLVEFTGDFATTLGNRRTRIWRAVK